jgi:hypothetical protein
MAGGVFYSQRYLNFSRSVFYMETAGRLEWSEPVERLGRLERMEQVCCEG